MSVIISKSYDETSSKAAPSKWNNLTCYSGVSYASSHFRFQEARCNTQVIRTFDAYLMMSEYEYIDLIFIARDSTGNHAMNFIVVTFSWLVVAYFAGEKLSKFQVSALTFLYAIFAPFPMFSAYESLEMYRELSFQYFGTFKPASTISLLIQYGPECLMFLMVTLWGVSVAFMFQARSNSKNAAGLSEP